MEPSSLKIEHNIQPIETEPTKGSSGWLIGLVIFLLLVIAGLIVWGVWATLHDSKDREIAFTGANVEVSTDTQITGTWPQTGTNSDVVTIYATLDPPIFSTRGAVTNAGVLSNQASNGDVKVSLSKLQKGLKYYATLVATNSNTANFQVYTQIVYMEADSPKARGTNNATDPDQFEMQHILQVGKIIRDDNNNVQFSQLLEEETDESRVRWTMSGGKITDGNENCLYVPGLNVATTGTANVSTNNNLMMGPCAGISSTTGTTPLENSDWTYNPSSFANRWCLTNTISATTPNPYCIKLPTINAGKTSSVVVVDNSTAGDAWVNVSVDQNI